MALFRILGDLRAELRARLGFSAAGAAAGVNQEVLNSMLRSAQAMLYHAHDWAHLRKYEDKSIGINQYLIDYPVTANVERVRAISILDGTLWTPPLRKGIPPHAYTYQSNLRRPMHWEPYSQIEFDAKADKAYTARIFFLQNLGRFTQDGDRASLDDDLVLIFALADGKAHYRQPDAENYGKQREALLVKLKSKSWGQTRFRPEDYAECETEVWVKPVVV